MRVQLAAEPVDHLVQRDEVRALDVPMRLLRQQRQIDRIGKTGIEDGDRNGLGIGWQVITGLVVKHFRFLFLVPAEVEQRRALAINQIGANAGLIKSK